MRNPKQLFDEIVKLAADALKGEDVNETEVIEETVVLAEEVKDVVEENVVLAEEDEEVVAKEETPAANSVAEIEIPVGVSKVEFDSAIAEIKEMYAKVLESISPSQPQEVPEALSEEVKEEAVELEESVVEEIVEEVKEEVLDTLVHDPETAVETKQKFLYSQNRVMTTQDYVFKSLFNK